jgi:hypothetical protein
MTRQTQAWASAATLMFLGRQTRSRTSAAAMMFLDCPAYRDQDGTVRCGLPARAARRTARRPNSAPAYYLGRPAGLWMSVTRADRGGGAPAHRALAAAARAR